MRGRSRRSILAKGQRQRHGKGNESERNFRVNSHFFFSGVQVHPVIECIFIHGHRPTCIATSDIPINTIVKREFRLNAAYFSASRCLMLATVLLCIHPRGVNARSHCTGWVIDGFVPGQVSRSAGLTKLVTTVTTR